MATPREQLADLLRQARVDAGYGSHGALVRKLNVSRPVITKAENAAHPIPSDAIQAAWAGVTGAPLDKLTELAQRPGRAPRCREPSRSTSHERLRSNGKHRSEVAQSVLQFKWRG